MKRLFWVAVGAGVAVVVVRRAGYLARNYLPEGPGSRSGAIGTVARVAAAARDARTDFHIGMAEREEQLRRDLVGEADIEKIRHDRAADRTANGRGSRSPARSRPQSERQFRRWADQPTEDQDDPDLPYAF